MIAIIEKMILCLVKDVQFQMAAWCYKRLMLFCPRKDLCISKAVYAVIPEVKKHV